MSHYKSNVRDQVFNLFEVFGVDKSSAKAHYSDLDADTAREMLTEMSRLAEGPVAESFVEGDRNPPVFDPETHSVTLPESSRSPCARSSKPVGTRSASTRSWAACRCPRRCSGRCTSTCSAPTRRCGCTAAARGSPRSSTTSAPKSRRSGPCWPPSAAGARPWCSPSRTPARTSAPAGPRPSSKTTAPGTSTA